MGGMEGREGEGWREGGKEGGERERKGERGRLGRWEGEGLKFRVENYVRTYVWAPRSLKATLTLVFSWMAFSLSWRRAAWCLALTSSSCT